MTDFERILLECRYLLSLNKSYSELAEIFNIGYNDVYHDLNELLPKLDYSLYQRVSNVLNKNNCS